MEASLPVSTPMEVSALSTQQVPATLRAPPRIRIVGTQRGTQLAQFAQDSVIIAHGSTDMSRGDDSPRVIQTDTDASSGFLRMFAQDLEANLAIPPQTWLET